MIAPRWRKVLRDLWLHKPRTLLAVAAIVIGVIGAGAVLDAWSILRVVTREGYLATNPASATLRVDSVDDALLRAVRAMPAIRDAEARRTAVGAATVKGSTFSALLFASRDPSARAIGKLARDSGSWPPADGTIVLEHSSVEYAGAGIGDTITVQLKGGPPVALAVTGIARDQELAPGWMDHVVYAFVTPATLALLNGGDGSLNQLQVVVRDGARESFDRDANRRAAREVTAVAERSGHTVFETDVPVPGRHMHAAQMDSLLMTQGAFGALSLLLSAFLVVNLMTAMLAGQVREIGIMKSIGARDSQIAALYLATAFALGLAACAVAVPIAAAIGRRYAEFSASLLNFSVAGTAIAPRVIVAQIAVGTLLPVLAAAVPVVRGCGISVSDALRGFGMGAREGGGARILAGANGVARPLLLSLRTAFRRRGRMALTLLTLALGGAVFLGALNLRAAIRGSVGLIYDTYNKFDASIRFARPHSADSIESLASRVPGVSAAEAWGAARAAVDRSDGMPGASFPLTGLPNASTLVAFPVEEGRWYSGADSNEIVVNKRLLEDEPALAPGSSVTLIMNGRRAQWRVAGLVESGPLPAAYASREALSRALGEAKVRIAAVRGAPAGGPPPSDFVERVRGEFDRAGFEVESSSLVQANREAVEDHLLMVAGFLVVMAQMTIVVGGLGLASTMSISVLERTREIGVLRGLGARHASILWMIQAEGLVISLLGWLLAIPLSVPMSVALGQAFGRAMFPVATRYVPEVGGVAMWLGVTTLVSLAACAWPARRATQISTKEALSYEG